MLLKYVKRHLNPCLSAIRAASEMSFDITSSGKEMSNSGINSSLWVCLNVFECKIYMRNMMMRTDEAQQMVGCFRWTYMYLSHRNISSV